jgi:DNA-binding XRE family transcriptional regulator
MASAAKGRGRGRKTSRWVEVEPRPGMTRRQTYRAIRHEAWLKERAAERRWIVEEAVAAYEDGLSLRQVADQLNAGFPDGQKISYTGVRLMLLREHVEIRGRDTAPTSTVLILAAGRADAHFDGVHPQDAKVRLPEQYDQLLRVVERASERLDPADMRHLVRVLMWLKQPAADEEGRPLPGLSTLHRPSHGLWKSMTVAELAQRAGLSDERVLQRNLAKNVEPVWPVWDGVLEVLGWYVEIVTDDRAAPSGSGERLPSNPIALGQVLEQHRMGPLQLTQDTVARAAGIARGTYQALEAGKRPTKYATAAAALARCGVTCRLAKKLSPEAEEELRNYQAQQAREAEYYESLRNYPRAEL